MFVFLFLSGLIALGIWGWSHLRERARADRREADAALEALDLPRAEAALSRFLAKHPTDAEALFLAARTVRRLGRVQEAEGLLRRYQEAGGTPENVRLEHELGQVQQGILGESDGWLRATIGPDHPDSLLVLEALARGYLKRDRLADALQACELWIARQPDHPWPWLFRGQVFERRRSDELATENYRKAVKRGPNSPGARLALGHILLKQRRPAEALAQFEHLLMLTPDDPAAMIAMATVGTELGRTAEATAFLDRAKALAPPTPDVSLLRAKLAMQRGADSEAEFILRALVLQSPGNREFVYQLLLSVQAQKKPEEAAVLSERLKQIDADHVRLLELQQRSRDNPDDFAARHEAGVVAVRMGLPDEGRRWLNDALRLRPGYAPVLAALAELNQKHPEASPSRPERP